MRAFFRKSADALRLFLVVCVSSCTAIMGTDRTAGFYSATTVSPIIPSMEIVPLDWFPFAYDAVKVCIIANGGIIRKNAPAYSDLHFFMSPDSLFYNKEGVGPFVGYAWGHTITFGRGNVTPETFKHEVSHLVTGEYGHNYPFWFKCDLMNALIFH